MKCSKASCSLPSPRSPFSTGGGAAGPAVGVWAREPAAVGVCPPPPDWARERPLPPPTLPRSAPPPGLLLPVFVALPLREALPSLQTTADPRAGVEAARGPE